MPVLLLNYRGEDKKKYLTTVSRIVCLHLGLDNQAVALTTANTISCSCCLTWMATLVGLVPGVGPDVLLQVGELGELPLADLAAVGLDAQVDPHVLGQI